MLCAQAAKRLLKEGRRVTLDEIAGATGIHRTTLSKVANQRGYNASTDIVDKLCAYFDVEVGYLVVRVKDDEIGD